MSMENYKTKDFYLAALFVCNGFKLVGSNKQREGVYFEFESKDDKLLQETISDFVNCKAMVNLKKFTSAIVTIRKELDKHR